MEESITISKKEYRKLLQTKIGFLSSMVLEELSKREIGEVVNEGLIERLDKQIKDTKGILEEV